MSKRCKQHEWVRALEWDDTRNTSELPLSDATRKMEAGIALDVAFLSSFRRWRLCHKCGSYGFVSRGRTRSGATRVLLHFPTPEQLAGLQAENDRLKERISELNEAIDGDVERAKRDNKEDA